MPKKKEYYDDLIGREFYEFYKKIRRRNCPQINQYNLFEKAVNGMCSELSRMMKETEYGVSLKGLGIFYRKPFGAILKKVNMFTQRLKNRTKVQFYFEDDYLRGEYIITNTLPIKPKENKKQIDKATAILLHRKLKLKR